MVDVGAKPESERSALATGRIRMAPATLQLAVSGRSAKGDVFAVARIAGIQAAKLTAQLIPLCHPLPLTHVTLDLAADEPGSAIVVTATVRTRARTGVEMEALTACSVALLTVYDMLKAVDRGMVIEAVGLQAKQGGVHGDWVRAADA